MLKNCNTHPSDNHIQVSVEEWKEMMSKFINGLENKTLADKPIYTKYDTNKKIAICSRTIILRKK
jgi:hypothetical protein